MFMRFFPLFRFFSFPNHHRIITESIRIFGLNFWHKMAQANFKVFFMPKRNRWRLSYSLNGRRFRPTFKTKILAQNEQRDIEEQINLVGSAWTALSASERAELLLVANEVRAAGFS